MFRSSYVESHVHAYDDDGRPGSADASVVYLHVYGRDYGILHCVHADGAHREYVDGCEIMFREYACVHEIR